LSDLCPQVGRHERQRGRRKRGKKKRKKKKGDPSFLNPALLLTMVCHDKQEGEEKKKREDAGRKKKEEGKTDFFHFSASPSIPKMDRYERERKRGRKKKKGKRKESKKERGERHPLTIFRPAIAQEWAKPTLASSQ